MPIWSASVCTTTSTRGTVSKFPTSLQKAIRGGERADIYARVITERVVSVSGEGPDTPAPVGIVLRAVQHRSAAGTPGWTVLCASCTTKSCPSAGLLESTNKRVFGQDSLAVSPSLLYSKNCRRLAETRRCRRGKAGLSCGAVRRH